MSNATYNLADLFKNPDTPLTDEQLKDWPKYMAPVNDESSASEVDITASIEARIKEINEKGTVWF